MPGLIPRPTRRSMITPVNPTAFGTTKKARAGGQRPRRRLRGAQKPQDLPRHSARGRAQLVAGRGQAGRCCASPSGTPRASTGSTPGASRRVSSRLIQLGTTNLGWCWLPSPSMPQHNDLGGSGKACSTDPRHPSVSGASQRDRRADDTRFCVRVYIPPPQNLAGTPSSVRWRLGSARCAGRISNWLRSSAAAT